MRLGVIMYGWILLWSLGATAVVDRMDCSGRLERPDECLRQGSTTSDTSVPALPYSTQHAVQAPSLDAEIHDYTAAHRSTRSNQACARIEGLKENLHGLCTRFG